MSTFQFDFHRHSPSHSTGTERAGRAAGGSHLGELASLRRLPAAGEDLVRKPGRPEAEPGHSAESTPTGGWCKMKQASIFTENLPKMYHKFSQFSADI